MNIKSELYLIIETRDSITLSMVLYKRQEIICDQYGFDMRDKWFEKIFSNLNGI